MVIWWNRLLKESGRIERVGSGGSEVDGASRVEVRLIVSVIVMNEDICFGTKDRSLRFDVSTS